MIEVLRFTFESWGHFLGVAFLIGWTAAAFNFAWPSTFTIHRTDDE